MTSPAMRNKQRKLAALKGADISEHSRAGANAYELQLMQLTEFRRRLKKLESIERKIEAKRTMLPDFIPWVTGVMDADRGGQDDVFVTVMLWTLDTGDLQAALPMAQY
ncbi:MAG: phage terminase small subunit, partial [Plesiomonas sp.]